MELANVQVEFNQDEIKQYIQKQLDEQIRQELIFVDVNRLAEMMSVSRRWLEDEILHDPRIKVLERRKSRKKLYLYPEVVEAIRNIANEW